MSDIGKPVREIEYEPLENPVPQKEPLQVPDPVKTPEPEREKVPV